MTVSQLVEPNELLHRVRHNRGILQSLVGAFEQELPSLIIDLRAAAATGNCDDLARWAHRLKGATSLFTSSTPIEMLKTLELNAQAGSAEGAERTVDEICDMLDTIVREANEIAANSSYWPDETA